MSALRGGCLVLILGAALFAWPSAFAMAQTSFEVDQKVEVLDRGEWKKATIVRQGGGPTFRVNRYRIRYEDGREDWFSGDQLRAADGGASSGAPGDANPRSLKPVESGSRPAQDEVKSSPLKPVGGASSTGDTGFIPKSTRTFNPGDRIEVRIGDKWNAGTVAEFRNQRALVSHDSKKSKLFDEWYPLEDIRFPGEKDPRPPLSANSDEILEIPGRPMTPADLLKAKPLKLTSPTAPFVPDPGPAIEFAEKAVGLLGPFHIKRGEPAHFHFGGKRAFLDFKPSFTEKGAGSVVEGVDLEKGESLGVWPLMAETKVASVRKDGVVLAIQSDRFERGTKSRIDIFSLKTEPKFQLAFMPYARFEEVERDVTWVGFVENKYILTAGGLFESTIVLWELPSCRAIWRIAVPHDAPPGLSPGGKQLAVVGLNQVIVLDAVTGKILAQFKHEEGNGKLSFSPDGSRLMLTGLTGASIFEIASGKLLARYSLKPNQFAQWVDRDHALVGLTLYSIPHGIAVWKYEGIPGFVMHAGTGIYYPRRESEFVSIKLPTADALSAEKAIDDSYFMFRPGDKISLEVDAQGLNEQVREILTRKLEKSKFTIADGQPVKLRASITPGEKKDIKYAEDPGRYYLPGSSNVPTKTRTVQIWHYRLEIADADGAVGWSATMTQGAPSILTIRDQNDTIDAAFQRATAPQTTWFENATLPARTPKAQYAEGLGRTKIGPKGIVSDVSRK